jgi:hypothetical protein
VPHPTAPPRTRFKECTFVYFEVRKEFFNITQMKFVVQSINLARKGQPITLFWGEIFLHVVLEKSRSKLMPVYQPMFSFQKLLNEKRVFFLRNTSIAAVQTVSVKYIAYHPLLLHRIGSQN